jgi:hypothetical protein
MSTLEHKAPEGKFIVGEADYEQNLWNQVDEPYETLEEAQLIAEEFNEDSKCPTNIQYFVYDEQGLVKDDQSNPLAGRLVGWRSIGQDGSVTRIPDEVMAKMHLP